MRKSIFITAAALLCLLGTGYVQAQHVPTLDEVVYGGLIHTKGSTYVNWLEDGEHYSKTEKNPAGGYDIVSYRAKDNKKETLIPASMLVKPGTNDTLSVRSFTFNADHTLALIYTNTRRVWRYDTRGDYWVLDMKSGTLKQLGKGMPESSLMFAKFSPDSRRAAYVSRNNIYVEDLSTGVITPVTTDGTVKRLSPTDEAGQHQYNISPDGSWAVHAFSNAVTPPVIDMVSLPSHKSVRTIEDNAQAKAEYKALKLQPKEFVKTRSGELELDAWMIKPIDFDPAKKYPVIIDVYGEPGSATVQDVWGGGDLWHQYLANQGYIVVSIENRGARTPRGREWRKCIYGEVGTFASQDQAQGILDLARQYSFIDTSRIGITGWSGGGSQTLNCMFRYPDVFHTGIAIAFVADQRLYDTIYQERYMNTPQNNPDGYRKGSPISYAEGLKGNLLLIHGTGDDNVHYQNCERLVNELVRHGKIFSQISYPMRTHSISEGEGTTMHLRKLMTDYFLKHLPAGGR